MPAAARAVRVAVLKVRPPVRKALPRKPLFSLKLLPNKITSIVEFERPPFRAAFSFAGRLLLSVAATIARARLHANLQ
jgi:hypothetical protein